MTTKTTDKNSQNAAEVLGDIATKATSDSTEPAKGTLNPERPSAEWSLDELGKFARKTLRQSAEVSWELGRTLVLAKEKASRKFGAWSKQYVPELSTRTVQRYMAVGRLDYEDVRGKSVSDIYTLLWGETHTGRKDGEPTKQATTTIKTLLTLLDGENASLVLTANRDSLVALHAKLTALLVG